MQISLEKAIKIATMANNLVVIFRLHDRELNIAYASDGVPAIFGYSLEEFEAKKKEDAFTFVSDYDSEFIKKGLSRCIEFDEPYSLSVQVKHKNLTHVFFSGVCQYLGSDGESFVFLFVLSEESGKVNKNQDYNELYLNEKRYANAIDFAGISTWDYDIVNNKIINLDSKYIPEFDPLFCDDYPKGFVKSGIIDEKDVSLFLAKIEAVKNGEQEVVFENWFHFPGVKQPKFIRTKYLVEYDKNYHPIMAHGMGLDLSEQKNAEINFEHRTNAVMRMSPDSLAIIQINLTENSIISSSTINSCLNKIIQSKTVDDLVANSIALIQDKNERIRFINEFSRGSILASFSSGVLQLKYEHHLMLKNNHDEWVRTVVDIVKNPITNDVEAVIHIINIHHHKVTDSMINGTVQREFDFVALAYIKTDSYVIIDRFNQEINEESPNFIESFKSKFKELVSIPSEYEKIEAELSLDNLVDKINLLGEYTIQFNSSDDPEKNHHRILKFSFLNNRKDVISISCRDMTKIYNEDLEQKEKLSLAVYEAEKANKAKSEFLSLVSHDIRTPLNGIMGMTQLALKEDSIDKIKKYLQKAEMSSSFLLGLINDLLDMSKIESGKVELHPEIYPFKEFIDYINSVIRPLCQKKNLHFTIHGPEMAPYIYIDKLRFNQIMFNLLSNSCKYTKEGGTVQFKMNCEKVNESLCIGTYMIKDNGIGMSDEFQEHLFETFSQENRMSFDHNEGTGLGLSITHSLIELMGGEITVDSEIDKGTTFTVQLTYPYFDELPESTPAQVKVKKEKNSTENSYNGCNFLLCEDNIINQEIANEILTNLGANVYVADDGAIGVEKFKESDEGFYTAIFMDIRMPNMDGLTASKAIRALDRQDAGKVPIIAMTANAMSEDRMECVEAGMNAFIAKPINIKELYKAMDTCIE